MEEIAQVYARSLFEVGKEHGKLDSIKSQLGQFADAVEQNRDLAVFFFSPYFATDEKKEGLRKSVEGAEPEFQNFLELLIENHRMPVLFRLRREYDVLWDHENRRLPVEVTTAERSIPRSSPSWAAGSAGRRARTSTSAARSTRTSWAGWCSASATRSWTRRSATDSTSCAEK